MSIETAVKIQSEIIDKLIKQILKLTPTPNHISEEKQEILDLQKELEEVLKSL